MKRNITFVLENYRAYLAFKMGRITGGTTVKGTKKKKKENRKREQSFR